MRPYLAYLVPSVDLLNTLPVFDAVHGAVSQRLPTPPFRLNFRVGLDRPRTLSFGPIPVAPTSHSDVPTPCSLSPLPRTPVSFSPSTVHLFSSLCHPHLATHLQPRSILLPLRHLRYQLRALGRSSNATLRTPGNPPKCLCAVRIKTWSNGQNPLCLSG
ncbi:hypothetical protein FA13DRAFT_1090679 [Coprinellus micaceus]|uniref:Uncharacterized protein n=1 Tax=Coprinellus micaceus TaxID=71717 RepID=A0A4Y7TRU6_COPMI|nr:hypothetical protein FA13DRAFT_1090679 [Coprinellus micaceus]